LIFLAALAGACDTDPTYAREIAPILAEQCAGCHRTGGVAPFPLETYDDARLHADAIAAAVKSGKMPPWPAKQEGECPDLVDARVLRSDEVSVISRWAELGAPEGSGGDGIAPPKTQARWLDKPGLRVAPPELFLPPEGEDHYRCYVMDPGLQADQFLTAYAIGDAQGVHHLHLWALDDDAAAAEAEALDAMDPGGGFACIDGAAVSSARHLTVWGPTDPVRRHPDGTGIKLLAGKKLLMQIHYHHATVPGPFLELELAPSVQQEAEIITIGPGFFELPPRTPATTIPALTSMSSSGYLWGVRAHMHSLGSKARVTLKRAAGDACLLDIPTWDEKWQLMYFFEKPIPLLEGDVLTIDCTYDTTTKTEPTLFGPTADDEMCNANFFVTRGK
jgi:hypothetical protein